MKRVKSKLRQARQKEKLKLLFKSEGKRRKEKNKKLFPNTKMNSILILSLSKNSVELT